jgi:hypothetical protein
MRSCLRRQERMLGRWARQLAARNGSAEQALQSQQWLCQGCQHISSRLQAPCSVSWHHHNMIQTGCNSTTWCESAPHMVQPAVPYLEDEEEVAHHGGQQHTVLCVHQQRGALRRVGTRRGMHTLSTPGKNFLLSASPYTSSPIPVACPSLCMPRRGLISQLLGFPYNINPLSPVLSSPTSRQP